MSANLVLDILLSLIVILFVPIGFWRGALKEVIVTAAILLGAAIATAWAEPWGDGLAGPLDMRHGVARFIVAAVALFLAVLLLGYGGGTLLSGWEPGFGGRLLGCVLAAVNGILLLGYALTFINGYLLDNKQDQAINDGRVTGLFLHHFDDVVLACGIILLVSLVAATAYRMMQPQASHPPALSTAPPNYLPTAGARVVPPRVPIGAETGKYEPAPNDAPAFASMPLDASGFDHRWSTDRANAEPAAPTSFNGSGSNEHSADEWLRRATSLPWGNDNARSSAFDHYQGDSYSSGNSQAANQPQRAANDSPSQSGQTQCPVCGGTLGPADFYCPLCGSHV